MPPVKGDGMEIIMKIENEARILKINVESILKRIQDMKLEFISANFQKRYVYDFIPPVKGRWIRLRTNGIKSTLTIKEIIDNGISGTKELEIVVSDFDKTNEILNKLGYLPRSYQENFRIGFKSEKGEFDIDFWPQIDPYFEIESNDKETVEYLFSQFGYSIKDITGANVDYIYRNIYGIELDEIERLEFSKEYRRYLEDLKRRITGEYARK